MRDRHLILVVDDERFNLNVLSDLLRPEYTVVLAKNGRQALERAISQQPDLILLDIMMPEVNGYDVIRQLKNNNETKDIPIIFITALNDVEEEEKGLELGAVDYIAKPFHPAIVRARVKTHLRIVRQRKLLESIALLDGLTEMPNRRSFKERYSQEWKRATRDKSSLSLAVLDVDFFKQYNDHYGHAKGDEVLQKVSRVCMSSLKRPADFAARIGGEEFVIILPNTTASGAKEVCENLRSAVEALDIEHCGSLAHSVLTVSIGGASLVPDPAFDGPYLIEIADHMLYRAKKEGKNCICWQEGEIPEEMLP